MAQIWDIILVAAAALASSPLSAATLPVDLNAGADYTEPKFDRIDYAHPEKYVDLPATLGKKATIEKTAAEIKATTPRKKLAAIGAWIDVHLKYDDHAANAWRDFDKILADGTYGGCADHALVFGALSRASGIPTAWVKTMDADWIRRFRRTHDESMAWSGHVFLEVHLDGKWALIDATQGILHADYDVKQRILPGVRFAYDKGGDPYEVLLSTRWEDWKKQTRAYFSAFDLAQLPVADGVPLEPLVFVAGNNPEWEWTFARCRALGFKVGRSGNTGFDEWLPLTRGQVLIVTCLAGSTVFGDSYSDLVPAKELRAALATKPAGIVQRIAAEGTRVIVVFGRDADALRTEIDALTLDD
jgi:hypothetical protein